MSDATNGGTEPAPVELPRGLVLSYVAMADSPTRVKDVSGKAVWVLGLVSWGLALLGLLGIGWLLYSEVQQYRTWVAMGRVSLTLPGWGWGRCFSRKRRWCLWDRWHT
jgi:hypothetical protein